MKVTTAVSLCVVCLFVASLLLGVSPVCAQQLPVQYVVKGEYLIHHKTQEGAQVAQATQAYRTLSSFEDGVLVSLSTAQSGEMAFAQSTSKLVPYNSAQVANDCATIDVVGDVDLCEPNLVYHTHSDYDGQLLIPTDPYFDYQWGLYDAYFYWDIQAAEAWAYLYIKEMGLSLNIVGVVDSGINYRHPDLAAVMWVNSGEKPGNGIDDDRNGYVDDLHGANTAIGTGDPWDCDGHGTHVAGIIGAEMGNNIGVVGINPSTRLLGVSTMKCGVTSSFSLAAVIEAFDYIINMKRRKHLDLNVVNFSAGSYTYSEFKFKAIQRLKAADIILVTSAGNDDSNNDLNPFYPGNYSLDNIVSVAALDPYGDVASFSNYGPRTVDIIAPGEEILSTYLGRDYEYLDGTSMSAPMVSGVLSLIYAVNPDLYYHEALSILYDNANQYDHLWRLIMGGRMVSALGSVQDPRLADACPNSPNKFRPRECGCNVPETDSDYDGKPDCSDECDRDPRKIKAGVCGCGVSDQDSDGDGVPDCKDACPANPALITPGVNGCMTAENLVAVRKFRAKLKRTRRLLVQLQAPQTVTQLLEMKAIASKVRRAWKATLGAYDETHGVIAVNTPIVWNDLLTITGDYIGKALRIKSRKFASNRKRALKMLGSAARVMVI